LRMRAAVDGDQLSRWSRPPWTGSSWRRGSTASTPGQDGAPREDRVTPCLARAATAAEVGHGAAAPIAATLTAIVASDGLRHGAR
jgi:hypothetical protein